VVAVSLHGDVFDFLPVSYLLPQPFFVDLVGTDYC